MDYVKAGEVMEDEFGRKIRVNRIIVKYILPGVRILNVFKFKWFPYFTLVIRNKGIYYGFYI